MPDKDVPKPPRDCKKILRWLSTEKYRELVDNRERERGALWVIARTNPPTPVERKFFEEQARAKGYDFRFVAKGSKATGHKPAWYWEPRD